MFQFQTVQKQRFGGGSRFEGRKVLSVSNKVAFISEDAAEVLRLRHKSKLHVGWDERAQALKVSKTDDNSGWSVFRSGVDASEPDTAGSVAFHAAGLHRMGVLKGDYVMLEDQPGIFVLADRLRQ